LLDVLGRWLLHSDTGSGRVESTGRGQYTLEPTIRHTAGRYINLGYGEGPSGVGRNSVEVQLYPNSEDPLLSLPRRLIGDEEGLKFHLVRVIAGSGDGGRYYVCFDEIVHVS